MGKIVIDHVSNGGVVLDIDTLERFIQTADEAYAGNRDAITWLPSEAKYIADALRLLLAD